MLYYSTNKSLRTTMSVREQREKKAARIAAELESKVREAIAEEIDRIWQPYYESDGEDRSIAWDAWAEQLRKECDAAVPSIVWSTVSLYMCGDIELYYNPTKLYRLVCKKLNDKLV